MTGSMSGRAMTFHRAKDKRRVGRNQRWVRSSGGGSALLHTNVDIQHHRSCLREVECWVTQPTHHVPTHVMYAHKQGKPQIHTHSVAFLCLHNFETDSKRILLWAGSVMHCFQLQDKWPEIRSAQLKESVAGGERYFPPTEGYNGIRHHRERGSDSCVKCISASCRLP